MMDIELRPIEIITDEHRAGLLVIADGLEKYVAFPVQEARRAAGKLRAIVSEIDADMAGEGD